MAGTSTKDAAGMPGGFGAEEPANEEVQALVDSVKSDFLKQSGANATKFEAVSYRTQVVAGINYCVKVDIGTAIYVLKIFKPLPHTEEGPKLIGCHKEV